MARVLHNEIDFFWTYSAELAARLAPGGATPTLSFYAHYGKTGSQYSGANKWKFADMLSYVHKMYRRTLIFMSPSWADCCVTAPPPALFFGS